MSARPNTVLVRGAWADGSSWSAVIERLQAGSSPPRMNATTVEVSTNHLAMVSPLMTWCSSSRPLPHPSEPRPEGLGGRTRNLQEWHVRSVTRALAD
jgi:hypothetical protein